MRALGLGPFWYSLAPQCWQWRCGADKIGYPRFHPMLLLGRAQTACSTCLELPSACCCLCFAADLRYAAAPSETFGLAGILWIAGIALLLCSAFFGSHSLWGVSSAPRLPRWPTWEMALLAVLFVLALLSRVWNLTNFPDNIYPDEIMTGTVATQSYLSPTTPPSVFSTLWSGIDLPALLVLVRGRMIL